MGANVASIRGSGVTSRMRLSEWVTCPRDCSSTNATRGGAVTREPGRIEMGEALKRIADFVGPVAVFEPERHVQKRGSQQQ